MTFYWYTSILLSVLVLCVLLLASCALVLHDEYRRGDTVEASYSIILIILLLGAIPSILSVLLGVGFDCTATR